jgi:hypothetical protein
MPTGRIHLESNRFAKFTNGRIIMTRPINTPDLRSIAAHCGPRKQLLRPSAEKPRHNMYRCTTRAAPSYRDLVIDLSPLLERMDREKVSGPPAAGLDRVLDTSPGAGGPPL